MQRAPLRFQVVFRELLVDFVPVEDVQLHVSPLRHLASDLFEPVGLPMK